MKTHHFKPVLCLVLMLLFSVLSFGQSQAKTVVITLIVNPAELGDEPNDPKGLSFFEVDPGATEVIYKMDPKDFTVTVDKGTKIKWQGITTTGENVRILKIQYKSGVDTFNDKNIRRCLFGKRVRKTTKRITGEGYYVYQIKFRPKGKKRFFLDPKIRVE